MTDTRPILATINPEQLDALLEIIEHVPDGTAYPVLQSVIISTVREARDRVFEIEKLTKAAIEDVREQLGTEPSPKLVTVIVESVWETIHMARYPHGEHGDGVMPGMEETAEPVNTGLLDIPVVDKTSSTSTTFTGEAAQQLADAFNLTPEQEQTLDTVPDTAAFLVDVDNAVSTVQPVGTAQRAVVTDDGGSVESKTSADGKRAWGADAAARGRELIGGEIPPKREPANDGTTVSDISDGRLLSPVTSADTTMLGTIINKARIGEHRAPTPAPEGEEPTGDGPVSAVSPQFGKSRFTSDRAYPSTAVDSEPSTPE